MIAFVTSLRHPVNSADYGRVETLLAQTLRSVTAQDHGDFAVFVVGNKEPAFSLPEKVYFVPVDFPPPVLTPGPRTAREPFVRDKGSKIGVGLLAAREADPDHVMIFDADDFVHRGIAGFAAQHRDAPGWVLRDGLVYSNARQTYRRQPRFNQVCGTSHIVAFSAYGVPAHHEITASQDEIVAAYGERLPALLGAHFHKQSWLAARGCTLAPLPFRGAVYHVDTGENHSGYALRGITRPVTEHLVSAYGVPRRGPSGESAWQAYGPPAAAQTVAGLGARVVRRLTR